MTDFNILALVKLFNVAKTEVYNKHEKEKVFIRASLSGNNELKETYKDICGLYHGGQEMTNKELFDFLRLKFNNVRVIL